jgi:hypothetical protein
MEFTVGAWVWLRLLHRPMSSLDVQGHGKLGPKFYGPFLITERIDNVVYRLQLPAGAKLHNIFHVGLLKKYNDDPPLAVRRVPPNSMGVPARCRSRWSEAASPRAVVSCQCAGLARTHRAPLGKTLKNSSAYTRPSSSRTSFVSRAGEMSWLASATLGEIEERQGRRWEMSQACLLELFPPIGLLAFKLSLLGSFFSC